MDNTQQHTETTLGTRLSTGAVNAGIFGTGALLGAAMVNTVRKHFGKSASNIKIFSKEAWWIGGITAAITGAVTFFTANRDKEIAKEKALADYIDPTKGSASERSATFDKQWDAIEKGDFSNMAESTRFRDKIESERTSASGVHR